MKISNEAKNLVDEHFETVREKIDEVNGTLDNIIDNLLSNSSK
jgi:hypothetical protein